MQGMVQLIQEADFSWLPRAIWNIARANCQSTTSSRQKKHQVYSLDSSITAIMNVLNKDSVSVAGDQKVC